MPSCSESRNGGNSSSSTCPVLSCPYSTHLKTMLKTVIGHYFHSYFLSIFDPTSLHIPYPSFSLMLVLDMFLLSMLSHSRTDDKNTFQLVLLDAEQLVYWATDIPKQSCCGSSPPRSCAGTSSAATERSHHSKFRTSRTRSMSRSVSIT